MANEQNLRPSEYKLSQEEAKKGGVASGKARREKANLRKMAQEVLDGTFTDNNGKEVTGTDLVIRGLVQNLAKPGTRNWGKAMDLLITLTSAAMSPEQKANLKASTAKIKAETDRMKDSGEQHNGILEALIKGLQDNGDVHTETESPDAEMASRAAETN